MANMACVNVRPLGQIRIKRGGPSKGGTAWPSSGKASATRRGSEAGRQAGTGPDTKGSTAAQARRQRLVPRQQSRPDFCAGTPWPACRTGDSAASCIMVKPWQSTRLAMVALSRALAPPGRAATMKKPNKTIRMRSNGSILQRLHDASAATQGQCGRRQHPENQASGIPAIARAKSSASKGSRSSMPSPTPMK